MKYLWITCWMAIWLAPHASAAQDQLSREPILRIEGGTHIGAVQGAATDAASRWENPLLKSNEVIEALKL